MEGKQNICETLRFNNPYEVYIGLQYNAEVKQWLDFVSSSYISPGAKVLLLYPCSTTKPYNKARSYKVLYATLEKLGQLKSQVHVVTISEPFGVVPSEYVGKKTEAHDWENRWYDCPGLFEWWCRKNGQPYERKYLDKSIAILAKYVGKFLERNSSMYSRIIAFIRTYSSHLKERYDHTHKRIIKMAAKIANVEVEILPPKSVVAEIVTKYGRLAWDLYGVAHPHAQQFLLEYLREVLK